MSEETSLQVRTEFEVQDVVAQVQKIQQAMHQLMKKDEHYGVIPGCGKKPSLLKPGAEKLGFMFRLAPKFYGEREPIDLGRGNREYVIRCELVSIATGAFVGSGVGSCSTMEAKYRYRTGPKETTGLPVPGEYWNLRKSDPERAQNLLGGKGRGVAKNDAGQWEIVIQGEKAENDNPADVYNTVLKMAKKRAHVDAILTATAASDIFTQDLEDIVENGHEPVPEAPRQEQKPKGNGHAQEPPPAQPQPAQKADGNLISEAQAKRLFAIGSQTGMTKDDMKSMVGKWGYQSSREIKRTDYEAIVAAFEHFGQPTYAEGSDPDPMLKRTPGQEG